MTLTIQDYLEHGPSPDIEVIRVSSTTDGDVFYSRKFQKIKAYSVQNHGATFATGVARDSPKITITQGTITANAKVAIGHTTTTEVFSFILVGEL